jgi:hypothetical protein
MMCPVKLPHEMSALSGTVSSVHGLSSLSAGINRQVVLNESFKR